MPKHYSKEVNNSRPLFLLSFGNEEKRLNIVNLFTIMFWCEDFAIYYPKYLYFEEIVTPYELSCVPTLYFCSLVWR